MEYNDLHTHLPYTGFAVGGLVLAAALLCFVAIALMWAASRDEDRRL